MSPYPKTIYFAGELFSFKHLLGNAALAHRIQTHGEGRYICALPQSLEQRGTTLLDIRNQDIHQLMQADLCLCNFDGTEVDSGTVVEFMIAKFLDIPTILLRTDFRKGGDHEGGHWNLMLSGYPRTRVLAYDAMAKVSATFESLSVGKELSLEQKTACSTEACLLTLDPIAREIVETFDLLCDTTPVLSAEHRKAVYAWVRQLPGSSFHTWISEAEIEKLLAGKIEKGLI